MGRKSQLNDVDARSYGVYLTKEQRDRMDILAFLKKKTRSEVIRDLIQETLDAHKPQIDAIIEARDSINESK